MGVTTIGSALAEKRRELGLEKGQAAEKIGMSRTTYSSYEQDAQRPSVDVFPAIAGFLEISMEELLTLYGATCIAAVRPALSRLISDQSVGEMATEQSQNSSSETEALIQAETDVPQKSLPTTAGEFDSSESTIVSEVMDSSESEDAPEFDELPLLKTPESWPERYQNNELSREGDVVAEELISTKSTALQSAPFEIKVTKSEGNEKHSGQKKKKKKKKK